MRKTSMETTIAAIPPGESPLCFGWFGTPTAAPVAAGLVACDKDEEGLVTTTGEGLEDVWGREAVEDVGRIEMVVVIDGELLVTATTLVVAVAVRVTVTTGRVTGG